MVPRGRTVTALWFAIVAYDYCLCPAYGSADEFQCACAYNARERVQQLRRTTVEAGGREDAVRPTAEYGALVSRMLFVAHGGPEPTARWLWLLHLLANASRRDLQSSSDPAPPLLADCLERVRSELDEYAKICDARRLDAGAGWSQQTFEKYVLENVTSIVQNSDDADRVRETDFEPRLLYLNDVAAAGGGGGLSELLTDRVGVDWKDTADRLSRLYRSSVRKWVLGTRELVLYQKTFLSTVAASAMGYVLIHVTHCQRHWSSHFKDGGAAAAADDDDDNGLVGEYERVWMSVGGLLDKFKSYLALGPEKYFRTLVDIAGNPVWDDDGFGRVTRAIEANVAELGRGAFAVKTAGVRATDDEQTLAAAATVAAKEKPFIELVALVDNNISAAETYLKRVQSLLSDVDFRVINDFMRSTHVWLT